MSLKAWQETWLRLMLAPEDRATLLEACPAGLSSAEWQALQQLPPERLDAIAGAVQRGRTAMLQGTLPASLQWLLGSQRLAELAERYARSHPAAVVYPPEEGLEPWLAWLAAQPELRADLLLQDVLRYERCLLPLRFFQLPDSAAPRMGPVLAACAGLLVAGLDLQTALQQLAAGQIPPHYAAHPTQGWLVWRDPQAVRLQPLHWGLYALLSRLQGQLSWSEAVAQTLTEHPELQAEEHTLQAWEAWFWQQELLN